MCQSVDVIKVKIIRNSIHCIQ